LHSDIAYTAKFWHRFQIDCPGSGLSVSQSVNNNNNHNTNIYKAHSVNVKD